MIRKILIFSLAVLLAGATPDDAREANEAYRNGEYEKAVELYRQAIDSDPDNARLYFNLGNALAKTGQSEEAVRTFEKYKSMTDDPAEKARADYNMGNIYTDGQQWDRALDYYRNALRYRNGDADAKHNYELAMRKQREQQQQQQNQQQGQNQNNQQQNRQDRQQQNQNQQNQQQNQEQQEQQQQNQQQRRQNSQISKAEAEKILQALEQKERDLLKEFKKQKTESSTNSNEKDW